MNVELLFEYLPYVWLALGLLLLLAEALGAGGFLLGAGVAGLATGGLVGLLPELPPSTQLLTWAVMAAGLSFVYYQLFRDLQDTADESVPGGTAGGTLTPRAAGLVGTRLCLDEDLTYGEGRIQIGDTFWKVVADDALAKGTEVAVVAADKMTLKLARAS